MKATLEFNLPEEQTEFNRANQSLDMACALFDILQLRKSLERKYESIDNIDNTNNDIFDGIEVMANEIYNVLEKHNINIDNLIE
jgi:molecular chaperone GrpE (heat shock protein)